MSTSNLEKIEKIKQLKEKRDAIILSHNYQDQQIQDIADIIGDSFELSKKASEVDASTIVFCGVHFMAECAHILAPQKTVLLPDKNAGCPMADMADVEEVIEKKKEHPHAKVVAYVNTSARVKAEVDICCTSSNALEVVNSLDTDEIIFLPDKNLAWYISQKTDKKIIPWNGYCITHARVSPKEVDTARYNFPEAPIICHPECPPEVHEKVDYVMGTGGMVKFAKETSANKIIIGTEMGLIYRLQKENPDKEFLLLSQSFVCPNMKKTNLDNLLAALENMENKITVEPEIRDKAKNALIKMLEIRGDRVANR